MFACRQEELGEAMTIPMLQRCTQEDKTLAVLLRDIRNGRLRKEKEYEKCFTELSVHDGIILKGE